MSTTATITARESTPLISVLQDYEIHNSDQEASRPLPSTTTTTHNGPPDWPVDHRRIPPFRPANTNLDFSERPAGSNTPESILITVMLHGVWLNAVTSRLWRFTGGRLNNRLFHYSIGGER